LRLIFVCVVGAGFCQPFKSSATLVGLQGDLL